MNWIRIGSSGKFLCIR